MEMTVKEVLIAARAKIADPANWTQGESAKDANDRFCLPKSTLARCWCSIGALAAVIEDGSASEYFWKADDALARVMGTSTHRYNDTHTHAEVLAKFDEAIAAQGGE